MSSYTDIMSDGGMDPRSRPPLNGIRATSFHDEGAIAQCFWCRRYTLDTAALGDRPPLCECGKPHGWSGSFARPGTDAKWSGERPAPAADAALRATGFSHYEARPVPGVGPSGPMRAVAVDKAGDEMSPRQAALETALRAIAEYAHEKSSGPAAPDALWEVRRMAYDVLGAEDQRHISP